MRIVMVCAYGMSTSMLMKRMQAAAGTLGISAEISAHSPGEVEAGPCECDIILLGPQVAYHRARLQVRYPGIPVCAIDMADYGMMDGKKVLEKAIEILRKIP